MNKVGVLSNKAVIIGQQNIITAGSIVITKDFYSKLISGELFNTIKTENTNIDKDTKETIVDILKEEQDNVVSNPEVLTKEDLGITKNKK